jgi:uncharacterized membrane protein
VGDCAVPVRSNGKETPKVASQLERWAKGGRAGFAALEVLDAPVRPPDPLTGWTVRDITAMIGPLDPGLSTEVLGMRPLAALLVTLSALLASGASTRAQGYVLTELSPVSSFGARAWEINEVGIAVGHGLSPSLQLHALVWPGGPTTDLTPTNALAEAHGLSNGGIVAGWSRNASGATEATRWIGGQGSFLGWLPGHIGSLAQDANDAGLICGWSVTSVGDPVACVWIDGNIEAINVAQSWAFAVSETGDVVGRRWAGVDTQAFRWRAGDLVVLPDLGPHNAQAVGISPAGRVAGSAESPVTGRAHAVVWEPDGSLTDLGPYVSPTGPASAQANDVNDAGIAVGTAFIDPVAEITFAMVWRGAGAENLNGLIPPGSGWTLSQAQAVNDRGEIVGFGTKGGLPGVRAFRLRPDCDGDGHSDLDEIAAGSAATLALDSVPPAAPLWLVVGALNQPTHFKGGVLVPTPPLLVVPGLGTMERLVRPLPSRPPPIRVASSRHGGGRPFRAPSACSSEPPRSCSSSCRWCSCCTSRRGRGCGTRSCWRSASCSTPGASRRSCCSCWPRSGPTTCSD